MERLRSLQEEQLVQLLQARPDLLACTSLNTLAEQALSSRSIGAAIAELSLPQRQVVEALHLLGHRASFAELREIDLSADEDVLWEVVESLFSLLLVDGDRDELVLVRPAEQWMTSPLGFGRPVVEAHRETPYYDLVEVLRLFGAPRPRSGDEGRRVLAELFSDAPALVAQMEQLPPEARSLLRRADEEGPVLRVPGLDLTVGKVPDLPGLDATLSTGLLVALNPGRVELPLEVGVALRWPRFGTFDLEPAILGASDEQVVAAACGAAVQQLLDAVTALGNALEARPVPVLASGGVGVKEVRGLTSAGLDVSGVSFLLRLLHWMGLINKTRKDLRVTKEWTAWAHRDDAARWEDLVLAWLDHHELPVPRPGSERRPRQVLGWDFDQRAIPARLQCVRLLAARQGHAGTTDEWLRAWHVRWPARPLRALDGRGHLLDTELRADVLHEAELLGLLAADGATPLAHAVHDDAPVEPLLATLSDVGETHVRAQADLTLVCTGRPSRTMRAALDRIADLESSAQATVWRLSEASLSRAYDLGDGPDDVASVLETYAAPVPQPMAYLVQDAHRRFSPVRVGSATSYVVLEDDLRLQEALARRGAAAKAAKAIGLVRIAPGVAVSKGTQAATIAALKELGLHASTASPSGTLSKSRTAPSAIRGSRRGRPVFDISDAAKGAAKRLR